MEGRESPPGNDEEASQAQESTMEGGNAPRAALLLNLGYRIEAVQFIRSEVPACCFMSGTPEDGGRRIKMGVIT